MTYNVTPMLQECELLEDSFIFDPSGEEEYTTTIPKGFKGNILGLSNSDCYIVYFGDCYDEVKMIHKDQVKIIK